MEQVQHFAPHLPQLFAQVEFQVHEDLVVAGAAGVDLLAQFAQFAGKHQLDLGMDVFHVVFDLEDTGLDRHQDAFKPFGQGFPLGSREQSDAFEHPDMGLGAFDVALGQSQVERAVVSDGEPVHELRSFSSLVP